MAVSAFFLNSINAETVALSLQRRAQSFAVSSVGTLNTCRCSERYHLNHHPVSFLLPFDFAAGVQRGSPW